MVAGFFLLREVDLPGDRFRTGLGRQAEPFPNTSMIRSLYSAICSGGMK
jgi:hypothetical protein